MNERRDKILKAVVEEYIATAQPVGSKYLFEECKFNVSPATLRHEMQVLEEAGFLMQPHTSSGRVPSDKGYRYYVDHLLNKPPVNQSQTDLIRKRLQNFARDTANLLEESVNLLYEISHYFTAGVFSPVEETLIKQVQLILLDIRRILLLLFTTTGLVTSLIEDAPVEEGAVSQQDLNKLSQFLSEALAGKSFRKLPREEISLEKLLYFDETLRKIGRKILGFIKENVRTLTSGEEYLVYKGTTSIIREPEFSEGKKLAAFFKMLDEKKVFARLLENSASEGDLTIKIGSENRFEEVKNCSVVISRFHLPEEQAGLISLIGPTRMNYKKVVSAVETVTEALADFEKISGKKEA